MKFSHILGLETNGMSSSTLLVNVDGEWGILPSYPGNSIDDDHPFVLFVGSDQDLLDLANICAIVGVTRIHAITNDLVVEPNEGGDTCVQVRYYGDEPVVVSKGNDFLGMGLSSDQGNYAVLWYPGSILAMIAAAHGKFDEWADAHRPKRGAWKYEVPGDGWRNKSEVYDMKDFDWQPLVMEDDCEEG